MISNKIRKKIVEKRVILITGGVRRLGKEIALVLAEENFTLILSYFRSPLRIVNETIGEIKKYNSDSCAFKADISRHSEIKRLFNFIKKNFGRLDVLINNAAVYDRIDFFKINEKNFDRFIDTNLKSVVFSSLEAAKLMENNTDGKSIIINIASLGAYLNWTESIPYSVSKAAVVKFTQLSARRLAPNILVNSIAPATLLLENSDNVFINKNELKSYPVKRFGKASDIASLVKYLVNRNEFITGHTFIVDGGRTLAV